MEKSGGMARPGDSKKILKELIEVYGIIPKNIIKFKISIPKEFSDMLLKNTSTEILKEWLVEYSTKEEYDNCQAIQEELKTREWVPKNVDIYLDKDGCAISKDEYVQSLTAKLKSLE